MATNEHSFKVKKGLVVGDGITVDGGIVDFSNASSVVGITAESATTADKVNETVKNVSGGTLAKGTVVYQSGSTGTVAEVQAATNSSASTMPAIGILNEELTDQSEGEAILIGKITGVNTSSFSAGDTLYVGTSGALTTTKPTGEGALIQNIGKVLKVHATAGVIMITGAGRSNATPNLNDGNIFIGNASDEATTGSLDTLVGNAGYIKSYTVTSSDVDGLIDTHLNQSTAASSEVLSWNGSDYDWVAQTAAYTNSDVDAHLNQSNPTSGYVLSWNGSDYAWIAQSGGGNAALDTSGTTAANASGSNSTSLGEASTATAARATAVGYSADATGERSSSLGAFAEATGYGSTAIGYDTLADQNYSVAIGHGADTTAANQLMLGQASTNFGFTDVIIGNSSYSPSSSNSVATKGYVDANAGAPAWIASQDTAAATASGNDSLALGGGADTNTNTTSIAIGTAAEVSGSGFSNSIAIGYESEAGSSKATALGAYATATGVNSVALGGSNSASATAKTQATANGAVALGFSADAQGTYSGALGTLTTATHDYSTALGYNATTDKDNQAVIGGSALVELRANNYKFNVDQSLTASEDGYVMTYNNTSGELELQATSGGYADADVDTHLNQSTAATNEVLSWNGSDYDWVAQTAAYTDSDAIAAVGAASVADTQIAAASIGDLSDVDITTAAPTDGQALVWNATNSEFEPGSAGGGTTVKWVDGVTAGSTDEFFLKFQPTNIVVSNSTGPHWVTPLPQAYDSFAGNFSITDAAAYNSNDANAFKITNNTGTNLTMSDYEMQITITTVSTTGTAYWSFQMGYASPNNTFGNVNVNSGGTPGTYSFSDTSLNGTWNDGDSIRISTWFGSSSTVTFTVDSIALYRKTNSNPAGISLPTATNLSSTPLSTSTRIGFWDETNSKTDHNSFTFTPYIKDGTADNQLLKWSATNSEWEPYQAAINPQIAFHEGFTAGSTDELIINFDSSDQPTWSTTGQTGSTNVVGGTVDTAASYIPSGFSVTPATGATSTAVGLAITQTSGSTIDMSNYQMSVVFYFDGGSPTYTHWSSFRFGAGNPNFNQFNPAVPFASATTGVDYTAVDTSGSGSWTHNGTWNMNVQTSFGWTGDLKVKTINIWKTATGSSPSDIDTGSYSGFSTTPTANKTHVGYHISGDTTVASNYLWSAL